jgi:hypothetical protein
MFTAPTTRPDDNDEYTDAACLTDDYASMLTASNDYDDRFQFLGEEVKNDAVQGTMSDGAESIRDNLIALGHRAISGSISRADRGLLERREGPRESATSRPHSYVEVDNEKRHGRSYCRTWAAVVPPC